MSYAVTQFAVRSAGPQPRIDLTVEVVAREAGLHPDVVLRLVRLGAVDVPFARDAAARLARVTRLRRDLGLSYSGAILAAQLLARIDDLEERLRRYDARMNSNER